MSTLLERVQQKVGESGVPQNLMRGASALQGSIENTSDPRTMMIDPKTGEKSNSIMGGTAIRSLATVPIVQKYMDQLIDSKYGALIPQIADNPALKQQILRKLPFAKTAVDVIMDRINSKRFAGMKDVALRQASGVMSDVTQVQDENSQRFSGQNLAQRALSRQSKIFPRSNMDKYDILKDARTESNYTRGRDLTEAEEASILDVGESVVDRAYKKKGLNILYTRKKGGLAAQRSRAGLDEMRKHISASGQALNNSTRALQEAQGKFQAIAGAAGPSRRAVGGRVNVGKLMSNWNSGAKVASMKTLAACFSNIVDKIAAANDYADSSNLINSLSSKVFVAKSDTKPRVFRRRDLDKDGGVSAVVNDIIYSGTRSKADLKSSLKSSLRKIKKELYFRDDIVYTVGK